MVNEAFCIPCRSIWAEQDRKAKGWLPHHPDGDSFSNAIQSRCPLCVQIWAELRSPKVMPGTKWCGTRLGETNNYILFISCKPSMHTVQFELSATMRDPPNHQLSLNTGSEQSFEFLISKYKYCVENHTKCSTHAPGYHLPARLLDVGDPDNCTICLVNQEQIPSTAVYATLSHCWGGLQPYSLTSATKSTLRTGVPETFLPKTFQHAFTVARRLGIQYLWIDSLCIFQDNLDDWSIQAATMQSVYRYAALNIAATAACNGSVGLFYDRDPMTVQPFDLDLAWRDSQQDKTDSPSNPRSFTCRRTHSVERDLDQSPLNRRAWVMQERLLSSRVVHYNSHLIYWECQETFANELHPYGLLTHHKERLSGPTRGLKEFLNSHKSVNVTKEQRNALYTAWLSFLSVYGHCQLTYSKDRLVALAGIGQRVSNALHDELVAGLWRARFVEQLCWFTYGSNLVKREPSMAPSWSWVNVKNPSFIAEPSWKAPHNAVAQLVELTVNTKTCGALVDGFARLRCRLVPSLLVSEHPSDWRRTWMVFSDGDTIQSDDHGDIFWDDLDHAFPVDATEGRLEVHLLALYERYEESEYASQARGIILVPSAVQRDAFERVGYFESADDMDNPENAAFHRELVKRYAQAEEQIIKIV